MPTVLLLQVLLPITLLSWLALASAKSTIGYLTQAIATALLLVALYTVGLWMLLPWWLPLTYGFFWFVCIAVSWRRRLPTRVVLPVGVSGWAGLVIMLTIGALTAYLSWQGVAGRQLPDVGAVDIAMPLGPGNYLVASGGSRELVNAHLMTLNPNVERFRAYRGQSYGIDIIKIDRFGFRSNALQARDPRAYEIYGEAVTAPCEGTVIASRNDRPDMPVPVMDLEVIEGNHVLLRCDGFEGDVEILLAHFQQGSVQVRTGELVTLGAYLGVVGNSGKTGEPHLHISAQRSGSDLQPLSGEPLAVTIDGEFLVRNDVVRVRKT